MVLTLLISIVILKVVTSMAWYMTLWSIGIAISPFLGFGYQYGLIHRRKSVGTFSIDLCGMLLFCNILRLAFRVFKEYDLTLVVQSLLMIVIQLMLVQLCVGIISSQEGSQQTQKSHTQTDEKSDQSWCSNFWRWGSFWKYLFLVALFALTVMLTSLCLSQLGNTVTGELIGFLALCSESLIMLPQVIENYRQQRVKGLSHLLVSVSMMGDITELAYYLIQDQPIQFILCGSIQLALDFTVASQIFYYKYMRQQESQDTQLPSTAPSEREVTLDDSIQTNQSSKNIQQTKNDVEATEISHSS